MKTPDNIKGKNPFRVPENYFEDANRRILATVSGIEPVAKKKGTIVEMRPFLRIAASFAALIILGYTALRIFGNEPASRIMKGISTEELAATCFEDAELMLQEKVDQQGLNDIEPVAGKSDIIDYLLLDNIDVDEIYNNL